ncbi:MAG: DinB family protein [Dehalococcoidia bacterium]
MVSEDIVANRDRYLAIMHGHATMPPEAIIESLRETQSELLAIFGSAGEALAGHKAAPDEWSLHELALHAWFTERLIAKLVHHMARGVVPPAEDLEGAGIGMFPVGDTRTYSQVVAGLRQQNEDMLDALRGLPGTPDMDMKLPHPYFGPLSCLEWAGFQRVHDLDHIQHARKILASVPTRDEGSS